jgi:Conjugative transposon protein TcpC
VAARVGLWALVGLGAFGGLAGLLRPTAGSASRSADAAETASVPPEMAGYAELAVTTWLEASGDEDDAAVESMFAIDPSTAAGDTGRRRASETSTIGARRVGDDYWAITVAAAVDELGSDRRWRPVGTWYVEVGVMADDEGALVAAGEPALVPAPSEPEDVPRPAGGGLNVPSRDDEEMASTVEGFLSALVADDGDVSRYLAPDVEIAPVTPAPFEQVSLLRWSVTELEDGEARVRLSARATSAGGVPRTLSYELGLSERAGRWEVRSLSGAPTFDEEGNEADTADESTTTTEPPASTTSVSISSSPGA